MDNNLELENKEDNSPKSTKLIKFTFILFGISSLLAWNTIITALEFLNNFVIKMDLMKSASFLNFAPNIIIQFILLYKKNLFKIDKQLFLSLILSIAMLILIPLCIIIFKNQEILCSIITIILFLIMGAINALCTSGFFAFASFFPLEIIIAFSTGQGIAGILLNIIMYILIPSVRIDDTNKKDIINTIIFFSISVVILIVCLVVLIFSLKNKYFDYYLNKAISIKIEKLLDDEDEDEKLKDNNEMIEGLVDYKVGEEISFYQMFKLLIDIDLLCVFIYIVTFSIYPVAFEHQKFFEIGDYNFNTILTLYNIFDTLGRYLISAVTPTKKLTFISVLSRGILLFTVVLNYYFQYNGFNLAFTSIFLIFNVSFLGLTNGVGTTLCFGIAPKIVNEELKGQAGASVSFFTIVGIFIGSLFSFLTKEILNLIYPENLIKKDN